MLRYFERLAILPKPLVGLSFQDLPGISLGKGVCVPHRNLFVGRQGWYPLVLGHLLIVIAIVMLKLRLIPLNAWGG